MPVASGGAGTITFGANAVAGFESLADQSVGAGDELRYTLEQGNEYEVGTGIIGLSGGTYTMTRTPLRSSNSDNSAISAGAAAVCFFTMLADDIAQYLADLANVSDTSPSGGQTLTWDAAASTWKPASPSGGITNVSTYANLPGSPSVTDLAFVTDTKALYIYDGAEWDRVYTGNQTTPSFTTDPPATLNLNSNGSSTVITVAATDAEGFPISFEFDAFSGSNTYTESSLPPQVSSLSKNNGVFTLTPSTSASNGGSFTGRFKASDGLQTTAKTTAFTLSFGISNCYGFDIVQTSTGESAYVVYRVMFVDNDGSNLHDNSIYASEVVYGSNASNASWHLATEYSTISAGGETPATAYLRTEMAGQFNTTLPASGDATGFKYGLISNPNNQPTTTKTITWTTARTIRAVLISGADAATSFWTGGYVKPYIGGNAASNLSSTSYTMLQATTSSSTTDQYFDFSV